MVDTLHKPLALVASDLHLSDKTWKHRKPYGDSYGSWNQIVDAAISQAVNVVILAGDLLDRQNNDSEPITRLNEGINRLGDAGIKVLFIQGQHELQERPWASLSPNAYHLHRNDLFPINDKFVVAGIDYQHKEHLQDELSFVCETSRYEPENTILVMHQVWRDWMGDRALPQGDFDMVDRWFPGLGLLITGDLHEQRIESYGDIKQILSPGSTCMQSIAEPEDKYAYFLQEGESGDLQIIPHKLNTRPVLRFKVDTPEAVKEFPREVLDAVKTKARHSAHGMIAGASRAQNSDRHGTVVSLVQVTYDTRLISEDSIRICLMDSFLKEGLPEAELFLKQIVPLDLQHDEESEGFQKGIVFTLESLLAERAEKGLRPEIVDLSSRLMSDLDPEKTLLSWFNEKSK